jgi:hypothetical protein
LKFAAASLIAEAERLRGGHRKKNKPLAATYPIVDRALRI